MTAGPVQIKTGVLSGTATPQLSFATLPAVGNYVVVAVGTRGFNNTQINSLQDNQVGNTYASEANTFNGDCGAAIYLAKVSGSSGTFTVQANLAGAASEIPIWMMELPASWFEGVVDQAATAQSGSATLTSFTIDAPAANANADDLVVALFCYGTYSSSGDITDPPASGYTSLGHLGRGKDAGYKVVSAIETSSASWTMTYASAYAMAIATFKVAATFSGTPSDSSAATGALTTGTKLAGAADAATTAAGVMGIYLYADALSTASASASLTAAIQLALAAADSSSASATLLNWSSVALAAPLYTGPGSIVDAVNEQWSNGAPAAGDTVYYDGTNMEVLSNAEVVATDNSFSALLQWLPSPGTPSFEALVMTPGFAAYADATTAASASMTTAITLLANAQALANATGRLNAQINLLGAMADVTSAAADLAAAIQMQAAANDDSVAAGSISGTSNPLSGSASSSSSASGDVNTQVLMLGAAAALVQATADLATQVDLAGSPHTSVNALGSLSTADFANVVARVQSQASGALTTAVRLGGLAVSVATAAAQLATQVQLSAAASAASTASATLVENPLFGNAVSVAGAGAALSTQDLIDAAVATIASATGDLTTFIDMSASAASVATGSGALSAHQPLLGSAEDDSAAAASLTAPGAPVGLYVENPWWVVAGIRQGATSRFPIISPTETEVLTFDFSDELLVGEELQGKATVSVATTAGENANPSAVVLGAASYDQTQHMVEFPVGNCPDGDDFYFTVTAPTTTPYKVLTRFGLLQSRA